MFVRYRSTSANARGIRVGVFALVNGLGRTGRLTADEESEWRERNEWYERAYPSPPANVYDGIANPGAVAWFKVGSGQLLGRIDWYLTVLDRYGIAWECVETDAPGRIVYEDNDQVVAVPAARVGEGDATELGAGA